MQFPHADPIPIPAPVWLMKALSLLTLTLHFFAVQILVGSLLAVIYFSFKARGKKDSPSATAALAVARRLPIVMTYVINLGVPPLLFAQVLYGRALYTSSILIAGMWISVIFLLMACYWLLYRVADRAHHGKQTHWHAIAALVLAAVVGHIYSSNMTLMLHPEVWKGMYAATATGLQTPPHDPTLEPRLLFVMLGGLLVGGLWLTLNSRLQTIAAEAGNLLRSTGAAMAVFGAIGELGTGYWVYSLQPGQVKAGLQVPFYAVSSGVWAAGFAIALMSSAVLMMRMRYATALSILGSLGAFLGIAGAVIVRDGIRDVTLRTKGLDVWDRQVYSNWSVIGLFFLVFVLGLIAIGWLLSVMKAAKAIPERVIS